MGFGLGTEEELFRQEVRRLLAEDPVRAAIERLRRDDEPEPDVRPLYRELGRRGLLAPNWRRRACRRPRRKDVANPAGKDNHHDDLAVIILINSTSAG